MKTNKNFVAFALLCSLHFSTLAQSSETVANQHRALMNWLFIKHVGKTVCAAPPVFHKEAMKHLRANGITDVTSKDYVAAVWETSPCPFSPYRSELRKATRNEIMGEWLFPESSQKLRVGPRMRNAGVAGMPKNRCDAVIYRSDGKAQHAVMYKATGCTINPAFFETMKKMRAVSSWSMTDNGRIKIERSDVLEHIEEWEPYLVLAPFEFLGVQFKQGDMVAYRRRGPGNEVGATTEFRHLIRMSE